MHSVIDKFITFLQWIYFYVNIQPTVGDRKSKLRTRAGTGVGGDETGSQISATSSQRSYGGVKLRASRGVSGNSTKGGSEKSKTNW